MKIPKSALFTAVLAAALILISCYQPLTELLIAAIEDDYSPVIVVETPQPGDTYYSTITVSGYINDDSLDSGDDKGLLRSLSITAAGDLAHKGRILIDSEGNYEYDQAFGTIGTIDPNDFIFNPSDRSFDINITTSDMGFPPQTLYIQINAEDFNGNESTVTTQLLRSEGPYLDLVQPAESNYLKGGTITIQGSVADSFNRQGEATEIASIRLEILAMGIAVDLDTTGGDNSVLLFPRNNSLDYDFTTEAPGQYQCIVDLLASDDSTTSLIINMIATDLNGNTTTVSHPMTQIQDDGPVLLIYDPAISGTYYYSKTATTTLLHVNGATKTPLSQLLCTGWVYSLFSGRLVDTAELVLSSGSSDHTYNIKTHPNTVYYDPIVYGRDYYEYSIPLAGSLFQGFDGSSIAELTLTATDNSADPLISTQTWQIRADSSGPNFSSTAISTDSGTSHVGVNHSVTLSFSVADGSFETGFDPTSLSGTVGGIALASGDFTDGGSGSYSIDVPLAAASQNSGPLDISITADDYIGNATTIAEGDFDSITFYSGTPTLTSVSITADVSPTDAAKPGDWITLTVSADQDLDPAELDVTIAGNIATINGTGSTLTARAQIPVTYITDPVGFSINAFANMVGTAGVGTPFTSPIGNTSSVTLYVGPPSLTARTVTAGGDKYAASTDTITVSITSDQPLDHGPTVDIGGNEVVAVGGGTSWTATTSDPADGEGTVSLEFSDIENIVGVVSSPVTVSGVTSGDLIEYYPGKPTLTIDTFAFENVGGGAGPHVDDLIVLEFSVDNNRVLSGDPTVAVSSSPDIGITFGTDQDPDPYSYRFEYTLIADDIGSGDVDFDCTINNYSDAAGTAGDPVTDSFTLNL